MNWLFRGTLPLLIVLSCLQHELLATQSKAGQVGGVCLSGVKSCLQKNSECVENKCLCSNFYRHVNGSCVSYSESKTLGEQCLTDPDCRGAGEFCSSSICICMSSYVDVGAQCKLVVLPGQFGCEDSRQCNKGYPGAECDSSRFCVCPHGMQANQKTCVVASSLSNTMLSDDQIQRSLYQRSPERMPALNLPAHSRRRYSPSAAQIRGGVRPNDLCSVDTDCAGYPYAFCSGTCKCSKDALDAGNTCILPNKPSSTVCAPGQTWVSEAGACMTVQQPGEPCQYSQQCSASESGAFCRRLKCECVYGMKASGSGCTFQSTNCSGRKGFIWIPEIGDCREVLPPGSTGCSHNLQCTEAFPDARCISGTCTCPFNAPDAKDGTCGTNCLAGETFSGVTGRCIPTVQPGGACLYSPQCHEVYPGITCDRNICRCPHGLVFTGSMCAQTCSNGYIADNRGICKPGCRPTQIEVEGECLDTATPSQPCQVPAQCTGGSTCQNGLCMCPRAMQPRGAVCTMRESPPQGSCRDGENCSGGSSCQNGICICPVGRQIVNAQCITPLTVVKIGDSCLHPSYRCVDTADCIAGICVCGMGKTPKNEQCVEYRRASPGESCSNGEDCIGGSRCNPQTLKCDCENTHIRIGTQCTPRLRARPGYGCSNGEVCSFGSICVSGNCICPEGMAESRARGEKECLREVIPDASCSNGDVCSGGSTCQLGVCRCERGEQIVNNRCVAVRVVNPGTSCNSPLVRCGGGAFCARGLCECPEHMIPKGENCVTPTQVSPGFPCSSDDICMARSHCKDGRCQCTRDMTLRNGHCIPKVKSYPNEACHPGDECLGGSSCDGRKCICPPGHVIRNDVCTERQKVRPGLPCRSDDLCIGQSICFEGLCQCRKGEKIIQGACTRYQQVFPGFNCSPSDECMGGSNCVSGLCSCPIGQISVNNECKMVVKAVPGASCANKEQCEGGSVCDESRKLCICKDGFQPRQGVCIRATPAERKPAAIRKTTARQCVASNQCPSGADCISGECKCKPGHALSRFGFCMPFTYVDPGMSCAEGEVCRGGSECREGMCACSEGLVIKENKCLPPSRGQLSRPIEDKLTPCPLDNSCKLPECFCSRTGTVAPGGFVSKDVPQMIVLAFDDPITDRTINIYKAMFSGKHRNPNGCPIKGTFFVSHQFNNYDQTQWLYSRGNEIAMNSITHENLMNATKERWRHEMVGLRDSLKGFSYVDETSMKGIRAPHLLIGGDAQFDMMKENGFLYDSSMPVREGPVWPQTLDHKLSWDCGEQNCPSRPHKSLWEIPLQLLISQEGIWHSVARTAIKPHYSRDAVNRLLQRNFYRNYNGNRAPFILNAESDFLTYLPDNGVVHAIDDFLKHILSKEDVFVVTISQMIEWMRRPVSLENINKFKPWQCNFRMNDHIQPCETPSICSYDSRSPAGIPHSFRVCGSCPKSYPWIEDPLGRKQLRK